MEFSLKTVSDVLSDKEMKNVFGGAERQKVIKESPPSKCFFNGECTNTLCVSNFACEVAYAKGATCDCFSS